MIARNQTHASGFIEPEMIRLSNGIPVILQDYEAPVAATYWWVRVGSGDEAPDEAGFAHFLEHMLFKDAAAKETGIASTGQMARAIESLGDAIDVALTELCRHDGARLRAERREKFLAMGSKGVN